MPSTKQDLFDPSIADKIVVYSDGSKWQRHCVDILPACVDLAHQIFGLNLPTVSFYFFSKHSAFVDYFEELFGAKPRHSWQTGTGAFVNGKGVVLISGRRKRSDELDIVMHEYGHALFGARYEHAAGRIPSWLNEGCAEYISMAWSKNDFKSTVDTIRNEAAAHRLPTFRSLARSVYVQPKAGYALARLMVLELMRGQDLKTIAFIFDEAKRRDGDFNGVIKDICGLDPKQLYQKVLADCNLNEPDLKKAGARQQKKVLWTPWDSRITIPLTLQECLVDLYFWKLEHFGCNYVEHELNAVKYPHWRQLFLAYLECLKAADFKSLQRYERDRLNAMYRLDPNHSLLSYVSEQDFRSVLCRSLPTETIFYLSKCLGRFFDEQIRAELSEAMELYLKNFPPMKIGTAKEAFENEFGNLANWHSMLTKPTQPGRAEYDRLDFLALAFARLLRETDHSKWGKRLQLSVQTMISYDENRHLPTSMLSAELDSLLLCDLPHYVRDYLSGGTI